jgi:hypothetical protein
VPWPSVDDAGARSSKVQHHDRRRQPIREHTGSSSPACVTAHWHDVLKADLAQGDKRGPGS